MPTAEAAAEPKAAETLPPTIEITRQAEAQRIIAKYTGFGAGSGVIPVPGLDVAAIATVQVLMVRDLLALYDAQFSERRVRTIVTLLLGSLSPGALAGATAVTIFKVVPFIGLPLATLTMPILASAATYAVGHVMASHLAGGGDLSNFDASKVKASLRNAFEEGKARVKATAAAATTPTTKAAG